MEDKLRVWVPSDGLWETWAERRLAFLKDPECQQCLQDSTRLLLPGHRQPRMWLPSGHIQLLPVGGGARLFADASSQFLGNDTAPVTAAPFTMAIWGRSDDATVDQDAIWIGDKDVADNFWTLRFQGAVAGDPLRFTVNSAAGGTSADTTTGYTANTWHHACAVEASATSHTIYIDGGSSAASTTSRSPAGADRINIGRRGDSTPTNYFSGDLAEAAVWNVALSAGDVALLAKAVSPFLVRPEALVFYCPIVGNYSPEIDQLGGLDMTVTGATKSAHPRVFYPSIMYAGIQAGPPAAGGPPVGSLRLLGVGR